MHEVRGHRRPERAWRVLCPRGGGGVKRLAIAYLIAMAALAAFAAYEVVPRSEADADDNGRADSHTGGGQPVGWHDRRDLGEPQRDGHAGFVQDLVGTVGERVDVLEGRQLGDRRQRLPGQRLHPRTLSRASRPGST